MSFDLGSLVTRMVVEGRAEFERAIDAGGKALEKAAGQGDQFDRSLANSSTRAISFGQQVRLAGGELVNMGERGRIALQQVGTGLTIAGLALAALVGLSVTKYAEYDAAISRSVAVTGAYGEELERVRELTKELGAETVFTAKEAAEGVTELGKAGISTANILGGALTGSLNLAAAGELAVADAAAITASTLNQFNLSGDKAVHVSDLLAAGAGKAQGSVSDMGQALNQAGLVANQMGISVEDATGTLAAFASAGLIGSDAGTSFRTMLLSLATPTAQQLALQKQYNIEAYDAQGNFIGLTALAEKLKVGLGGLSQQQRDYTLGVVFGSDAIRAANVLYTEGASGIQKWNANVNDSGYAARTAATNVDNLAGDLEKLGGALDTALIETGEGANGVLRELVQTVTALVDGFAELPDWMQQIILVGGALIAGILLVVGAFTVGIAKTVEFRANLAILRAEMPLTSAALGRVGAFLSGPWGLAVAGAAIAVAALAANQAKAAANTAAFKDSLDDASGATTNYTRELLAKELAERNAFEQAKKAGISQSELTEALLEGGDAYDELAQKVSDFAATENLVSNDAIYLQQTIESLHNQVKDGKQNWADEAEAMEGSATSSQKAADAYQEAADNADTLQSNLEELLNTINKSNDVGQDAISTNADYVKTLADVDEYIRQAQAGVEGYTLGLDGSTVAGSANLDMLAGLANAAQEAAAAQLELTQDSDAYIAALTATHQQVYDRAIALGATADEAKNLADQIAGIPTEKEIEFIVNTNAAKNSVQAFLDSYKGVQIGVGLYANKSLPQADGGIVKFYANGGMENHTAQIARAGDMRVWAEPETGGEAYIPFAASKRARSEAILATVARQFGGTYIPGGVRAMADGGTTSTAVATPTETRIRGTLDLGDGLTGIIEGFIETAFDQRALDDMGGSSL